MLAGRLPIMDVGTAKFGQSHSINRYIAKKNNWMGKTDEDAAVGKSRLVDSWA